jgi:hypothetical protein
MLPGPITWLVRVGVPLAAIPIPLGFFLSVTSPTAGGAGGAVVLIYVGAVVLAVSVVTLGGRVAEGGRKLMGEGLLDGRVREPSFGL